MVLFLLIITAAAMILDELGDKNASSAIKSAVDVVVKNAVNHRNSILSPKAMNQEHTKAFLESTSVPGQEMSL